MERVADPLAGDRIDQAGGIACEQHGTATRGSPEMAEGQEMALDAGLGGVDPEQVAIVRQGAFHPGVLRQQATNADGGRAAFRKGPAIAPMCRCKVYADRRIRAQVRIGCLDLQPKADACALEALAEEVPGHLAVNPVCTDEHAISQAPTVLERQGRGVHVYRCHVLPGEIPRAGAESMAAYHRIHIPPHCGAERRCVFDQPDGFAAIAKIDGGLAVLWVERHLVAENLCIMSPRAPGDEAAAELVTRKALAVDERHDEARACGPERRCATCGPGPNHDDVELLH